MHSRDPVGEGLANNIRQRLSLLPLCTRHHLGPPPPSGPTPYILLELRLGSTWGLLGSQGVTKGQRGRGCMMSTDLCQTSRTVSSPEPTIRSALHRQLCTVSIARSRPSSFSISSSSSSSCSSFFLAASTVLAFKHVNLFFFLYVLCLWVRTIGNYNGDQDELE